MTFSQYSKRVMYRALKNGRGAFGVVFAMMIAALLLAWAGSNGKWVAW